MKLRLSTYFSDNQASGFFSFFLLGELKKKSKFSEEVYKKI